MGQVDDLFEKPVFKLEISGPLGQQTSEQVDAEKCQSHF